MILDYPFQGLTHNTVIKLDANLDILKNYHQIAEMEFNLQGELDEDTRNFAFEYQMHYDFKTVNNYINFDHQVKQLNKKIPDKSHADNLLYLALLMIETHKPLLKDQYNKYMRLNKNMALIADLYYYSHSSNLSSLELNFIDKNPTKRSRHILKDNVAQGLILAMLKPYLSLLFSDHIGDISRILNKSLTEDTITYLDLETTLATLKLIKSNDSNTAFEQYLLTTMLKYIREQNIFERQFAYENNNYPNSDEARLIFIIFTLATGSPVVSNKQRGSGAFFKGLDVPNYNNVINTNIVKTFKDYQNFQNRRNILNKTHFSDQDFLQLYLPSIFAKGL